MTINCHLEQFHYSFVIICIIALTLYSLVIAKPTSLVIDTKSTSLSVDGVLKLFRVSKLF